MENIAYVAIDIYKESRNLLDSWMMRIYLKLNIFQKVEICNKP